MATDNQYQEPAWRDSHGDARDARRNIVTQSPWLTPYLGLRARLSQVWINRWTVLLLLVLVRILFAIADIEDKIHDAHDQALSSCIALEKAGSTMASAPHYMAQGVNELTATGVEKAVDGLLSMLTLVVTGVEEVITFAINVWTQTYLCLITLAITGALHVALDIIEDVTKFINTTIGSIGKGLHEGIDGFDHALDGATSGLNKIFGSHIPELNVGDSLDKLDHLALPPGLDKGLQKMNSSIPNFAQVNNITQTALRFPFEQLKGVIKEHTGNYTFNRSTFPVPQKQKMAFCSNDNGINDFFDGLIHVEVTARKAAIAVLVLLAIGVIIPMTWYEIKRWRMAQDRAKYVDDHAFDAMDAVYVVSRPYSSMLGIEASKRMTSDYKRRTLIRWVIAYCTSTPALFVLSLGLAGLFSGLIHYFCLKALTSKVPDLTHEISGFADQIVKRVDNVSYQWSNETNGVILGMNNRINHDVFGWVNTSTTALNNTLVTATNEMVHALQVVFNGTILEQPVMDVYNCLIGLKVAGIEKALTWVQQHAHIDFPFLANDTFALSHLAKKTDNTPDNGNAAAQFLDDPDDEATGTITKVVKKLVDKIEKHILQELAISAVITGLWVIVFLMGLGRMLWLMFRPDKTRGTGAGCPGWGSLKGKFGGKFGHNHSLGPKSPKPGDGFGGAAFDDKDAEKTVPPEDALRTNPFDTPRFPSPPPHAHGAAEPTLPNIGGSDSSDSSGANYRGQNYTLDPAPLPLFTKTGLSANGAGVIDDGLLSPKDVRTVGGGAVAPVMGHPRTSWRPEFVGAVRPVSGSVSERERMDSMRMLGGLK